MSLDLQVLKYILTAVPVYSGLGHQGYDRDPAPLLSWFTQLEEVFEALSITDSQQLAYARSRLGGQYLFWVQKNDFSSQSFSYFKYELFNKEYQFRHLLGRTFVRPLVNNLKNLIRNEDPYLFYAFPQFVSTVTQIYEILSPYEEHKYDAIPEAEAQLAHLTKSFRKNRIDVAHILAKDEDSLTPEEEELFLEDGEPKKFWEQYKAIASLFINDALKLSLAVVKDTNKFDTVEIGKLSVKIMENI
ncbi:uncharacterized protein CANTADRAFT_297910 [Suhomyces tanzawaensis NRRL Y-17324]|uniref:Uncharacterized protein n=1 Tax=Suhomyces tanzawaensis NRRL Y-17324 TaxID=984487 RepID=A0A1E4SFB9_9ASCO|nr:uncharacterized protein CANTADRAFT_297910 [Suhomyces tanzawaensis NRRL Y-17324]ODV78155.1 hypothetical protein CANTADRAFT_297910 [Suhomyces tanzawaensis NRRL Y-17324]